MMGAEKTRSSRTLQKIRPDKGSEDAIKEVLGKK
jgi:hypothetical protein